MILQNPWAWLGLAAIAGPILAHLLTRHLPRRQRFPYLGFLPASAPKPISRDRLRDLALLALRCLIIATAVAALTQPVWVSGDRARDLGRQIARAIIVDTSASVDAAAAQQAAAAAAADATVSRRGDAAAPATHVAGAVNWLASQPMRRELVIVSDFQERALEREDLGSVPGDVGIRLLRVAGGTGSTEVTGVAEVTERRDGVAEGITLLAGAGERAGAEAARSAAIAAGAPATGRANRPVAVLLPGFETREALLKQTRALDQPWMFDVLRDVTADRLVREAAARMGKRPADIVSGAAGTVDGRESFILIIDAPAHSLVTAAAIGAAARSVSPALTADERSTTVRTADELRAWERPAADMAPSRASAQGISDGRWLWLACLALLGIEMVVRRARRRAPGEVAHA